MEFDFSDQYDAEGSNPPSMKRVGLFGSTGSIGTQTLEVIRANPSLFSATLLTAHSNHELLIEQALEFLPAVVVITQSSKYALVKEWNYESTNLDLKFLIKTKLVDSKLLLNLEVVGYPDYFKNQDFWKNSDDYNFLIFFLDADGFEIYKKEVKLKEMARKAGEKEETIGFRYQLSEYLDATTYSKFESPKVGWNFPTKITKRDTAVTANQQLVPKAKNSDSFDHCAPNLSKEERLRRLALSGSVRQSGTNSYSVGLKTLSFFSDGGMIFCN